MATIAREIQQPSAREGLHPLRIADYHTYFVSDWDWGFSVWAHNACYEDVTNFPVPGASGFFVDGKVVTGTKNRVGSGSSAYPEVYQITQIRGPLRSTHGVGSSADARAAMRTFLFSAANNGNNAQVASQLGGANQAGHLIADSLGGPNTTWNLVPMSRAFNTSGGWRSFENRVQAFLSPNTHNGGVQQGGAPQNGGFQNASMMVDATYPLTGATYIPDHLTVTLTFNGVRKDPIDFDPRHADNRSFLNSPFLAVQWP